ncbi:LacI family DNA-binding transcriptional regulator [Labrenzia sp. CE80]|uniref:LacI family DNA-binding transcriptional regulator n=1 Tax=Labrenzia sp. CE80 TaxID=1788986 RepID=UPI00129B553D|nr:LacI family DNA-binding transcriptional regulator [Labrenzia sp. CE80]
MSGGVTKGVRVTAHDVAKRAGVSQSAVSRVFTPGTSVSPLMAEKVQKAADELGYRPNVLARSLITGRSRIIGLLVSYLENQFYPEALARLSKAFQAKGYRILVFMVSRDEGEADRVVQDLLDYQVDGIVAASVGLSDDVALKCARSGVPAVLFNRGQGRPDLCEVTSDNRGGARQVADLFVTSGRKRIAHISGWSGSSTARERAEGFQERLVELDSCLFAEASGDFTRDGAAEAARLLFDAPRTERPDAVFIANDHMAFAVMDVLRFELKLQIPDEVSVVGYDDVPMAGWPSYNLTTVSQSLDDMVLATVTQLLGRIKKDELPVTHERLTGRLIRRESA